MRKQADPAANAISIVSGRHGRRLRCREPCGPGTSAEVPPAVMRRSQRVAAPRASPASGDFPPLPHDRADIGPAGGAAISRLREQIPKKGVRVTPADAGEHPEVQLSHLLPALWKALTRATRGSEQLPAIESQVSILRRLVDAGPMAPAQLADELYLARPTISNLLRGLEADGLVDRSPALHDGR